MNPHAIHLALIVSAVAATVYIAGLIFVATCGCRPEMPPEPPFVVFAPSLDAARE